MKKLMYRVGVVFVAGGFTLIFILFLCALQALGVVALGLTTDESTMMGVGVLVVFLITAGLVLVGEGHS